MIAPAAERVEAMEPRIRSWTIALVLVHLVVSFVHGAAHSSLAIDMPAAADAFIYTVILFGPLIGMALLFARKLQAGYWTVFATMLGSLLFGAWFHFMLEGPDHVGHVAEGTWGTIFQATAVLLSVTEAAGCAVALWGAAALKKIPLAQTT